MVSLEGRQSAAQIATRVTLASPSCHSIAKHLAAIAERSVRRLKGAAAFDSAHNLQQFGAATSAIGRPPSRKDVAFKDRGCGRVVCSPPRRIFGMPLARHNFEAVCGPFDRGRIDRFTIGARIDAVGQELTDASLRFRASFRPTSG